MIFFLRVFFRHFSSLTKIKLPPLIIRFMARCLSDSFSMGTTTRETGWCFSIKSRTLITVATMETGHCSETKEMRLKKRGFISFYTRVQRIVYRIAAGVH